MWHGQIGYVRGMGCYLAVDGPLILLCQPPHVPACTTHMLRAGWWPVLFAMVQVAAGNLAEREVDPYNDAAKLHGKRRRVECHVHPVCHACTLPVMHAGCGPCMPPVCHACTLPVIFEGVYQTHMVLSCVSHLLRAAVTCDVLCCLQWTMLTVDSAVVHMGLARLAPPAKECSVVVVTTIPGDSFNIVGNNPAVINDSQRQVWNVWAAWRCRGCEHCHVLRTHE
jgi:hypothetical protein